MGIRVRPRLIAVCGTPAAGKTTLARGLGAALHLPVLVRDDLKTGVADTFPTIDWSDPAVRRPLGDRLFDDFHSLIHAYLDRDIALVAEAAWHWPPAQVNLAPIFERARSTLVTVQLDPAISAARYRARFEAGLRHPSHEDAAYAEQMDRPGFDWDRYLPPADLPCRRVAVDGGRPPDAVLAAVLAALADRQEGS